MRKLLQRQGQVRHEGRAAGRLAGQAEARGLGLVARFVVGVAAGRDQQSQQQRKPTAWRDLHPSSDVDTDEFQFDGGAGLWFWRR